MSRKGEMKIILKKGKPNEKHTEEKKSRCEASQERLRG